MADRDTDWDTDRDTDWDTDWDREDGGGGDNNWCQASWLLLFCHQGSIPSEFQRSHLLGSVRQLDQEMVELPGLSGSSKKTRRRKALNKT